MEFEDLKVEVPLDDENDPSPLLDVPVKKYQNNQGDFVTGFDVTSKEAEEKRLRRAKRFGISAQSLENQPENAVSPSMITELPNTKQDGEIRSDAILLFGVNEMSTKDVFDYFQDYMPGSIEWIDDMSCVVVWEDNNSAKRALVNMGTKYTPTDDDEISESDRVENVWRIGVKHPKSKQLLMRYATKADKKAKGASSRSLYYLVHGRPGQQNKKAKKRGLVSSSRKQKIKADQQRITDELFPTPDVEIVDIDLDETMETEMDVDEPPVKVIISEDAAGEQFPRGNLYADKEEKLTKKARSRLSARPRNDDDVFICEETEPLTDRWTGSAKMDEAINARSRIRNMGNLSTKNNHVLDLRQKLKQRTQGFNPRTRPNLSIELTED